MKRQIFIRCILLSFMMTLTVLVLSSCCLFGHQESQWVTVREATCSSSGIKELYCEKCGEVLNKVTIPTAPHTPGEWIADINPSCQSDGTNHLVCSVCKKTMETGTIPAQGHTEGEWVIIKNATCNEEGIKELRCSKCNETLKTDTVPPLGHSGGDWITVKNATCTEEGKKELPCSKCNVTLQTDTVPPLGHSGGDWITDREATCIQPGQKHQNCTVCGDTYKTVEIPCIPHTQNKSGWITSKESNCVAMGEKHLVCSACGNSFQSTVIPAKGHLWDEWKTVKEVTKHEDGSKKRVCRVCSQDEVQSIPHNPIYDLYSEETDAHTCDLGDISLDDSMFHDVSKKWRYTFPADERDLLKQNGDKILTLIFRFKAKCNVSNKNVTISISDNETAAKEIFTSEQITLKNDYQTYEVVLKTPLKNVLETDYFVFMITIPDGNGLLRNYYFKNVTLSVIIDDE